MVSEVAIKAFRTSLRGVSFASGEPGYDAARVVFNRMIDRRPALIARCAGAADVIGCINFAREYELPVSVRGGGHSIAGKAICDDGLSIDLSAMKGIRVDPGGRAVRAEPGLTIGEFDRETQAFGLATTTGVISTTGIAGLTLGGGLGWLMGKHGWLATTSLRWTLSPRMGDWSRRANRRIPTCSGACAAAEAISVS
jgi:FAD/FMN-containing dehydrogenase